MIRVNIVGGHSDEQVLIWSILRMAGIPIKEVCSNVELEGSSPFRIEMENKAKELGAEIIKDKGKPHYGITTCVLYL